MDPPENMPRCVHSFYVVSDFWRNWHASFHHWLVRYVYLPAGGRSNRPVAVFAVFAFVAAYHDVSWNTISWVGIAAFTILVEPLLRAQWATCIGTRAGCPMERAAAAAAAAGSVQTCLILQLW